MYKFYLNESAGARKPGQVRHSLSVTWTPRAEIILQRDAVMSTHLARFRICMRRIHDVELCRYYGLWPHLDIALLKASLFHHVGTAKESAGELTPGAYR